MNTECIEDEESIHADTPRMNTINEDNRVDCGFKRAVTNNKRFNSSTAKPTFVESLRIRTRGRNRS
jgi:hypothetical protein